jgi:hypothetical protein
MGEKEQVERYSVNDCLPSAFRLKTRVWRTNTLVSGYDLAALALITAVM